MRHETKFPIILVCLFLFCGASVASPTLQLGTLTLSPGGTGILPLSLSGGTAPFAGINAKIVLPSKIHCDGVQAGSTLSGGFILDHRAAGSPEVVTVVAYSGTLTFTNGEALRLQLRADADAAPGTNPVAFAAAKADVVVNAKWALSDKEGTSLSGIVVQSGSITISSDGVDSDGDGLPDEWELEHFGTLDQRWDDDYDGDGISNGDEFLNGTRPNVFAGDVNGDMVVNLSDALLILRYYYNDPAVVLASAAAADVNNDTFINLSDALLVVRRHYNEVGHLGKMVEENELKVMKAILDGVIESNNNSSEGD